MGLFRTFLLAVVMCVVVFVSGVFAQEALVPFVVNVNATVSATDGNTQKQTSVTANQETILRIPLQNTDGVRLFGTQRQANVPTIISNRNGKVILNLPAQSYKNAEISLYTVNGKRILRYNASASSAVNNISHRKITTGVYLLSVRGADGAAVTSRMTHNGGGLDISVVFSGENSPSASRLAKKAASGDWMITVSAAGYVDSVYTLRPVAGINQPQNITLQKASSGGSDSSYDVVVIGGAKWTKKNLNIATDSSWCYENSTDSCAKYGRLYTWAAAKAVCRSIGWRLPSNDDWDALVAAVGGPDYAGKKLKAQHGWTVVDPSDPMSPMPNNGTDDFGFSALPSGYHGTDGSFYNVGRRGYWWTATEYSNGYAYYRYMFSDDNVDENRNVKGVGYSVRCVKDDVR